MEVCMKYLIVKPMDKAASGELLIPKASAAKHLMKKRSIKFQKGKAFKQHLAYNREIPLNYFHHCHKYKFPRDIHRYSSEHKKNSHL